MSDSFQDVYAKHLQHAVYGYPLRMPEPMSTLPENYQDSGLEIGDVGVVDNKGQFDVLFNICKHSDNLLHDLRGVPEGFQPVQCGKAKSSGNAISAGPIYSHGIRQILQSGDKPRPANYEFESSSRAGAILILPHGAMSLELLSAEEFRDVATKNALNWYEFANKCYGGQHRDRSLYLITGFYKADSWSLGSFNNPTNSTGTILARRDDTNPNVYRLDFTLPADRRDSSGGDDNGKINQTVFITGFKITVSSLLPDPIVLRVTESETTWSILVRLLKACLKQLRGFSGDHKPRATISVEDNPQLSQPFHPSDIINRFLLSKKPNAKVAITHDNQWMGMMKEGLTQEDLLQEDRLENFLMRYYTVSVDSERENAAVFLKGKVDDTTDSIPPTADPHNTSSEPEFSPPPTPSLDNPWIVITRTCIRAQNICSVLRRIPVGFYVLVQFDAAQRRTQNKSVRLNDQGIEWEDTILLPSEAYGKVRFTVYASFELEPMLGGGEALYTSESHVEELIGGTYLITFSPGESRTAVPDPSLLITLGRWYSNHLEVTLSGDDSNLDWDESSVFIPESCSGQEALLRYHNEYQREDFENAIQHFERAWRNCPLTHPCRAVVLVNLAKTKFIGHQIDPASGKLDESIQLYRQALDLRPPGHPDRSVTLLQLAQTLLFRYEKEGYNESDADDIKDLMTKPQPFPDDTHERRAADLMLETLERCRVVNSGSLPELNQLIRKLEQSMMVPPDGYFDIPQRLINLSTALWRHYTKHGEPGSSDLDRLLDINKQALQLLPGRHPDRISVLTILGAVLRRLFEIRGDLSYLQQLIAPSEEALQLVPEGHPERSYWVTNSTSYAAEMSERSGDTAFEDQKYDEAIEEYSKAILLRSTPS
ncbi:hypothetical protein OG21DRAFT_1498872 [Imleria badia]|nr:hypothetical protein OG21DRAFT_1498872 [Imleria badia]